jgi:hypothetical protein
MNFIGKWGKDVVQTRDLDMSQLLYAKYDDKEQKLLLRMDGEAVVVELPMHPVDATRFKRELEQIAPDANLSGIGGTIDYSLTRYPSKRAPR